MSSFILALFLSIILLEKPITVTLKDGIFEYTVSPPPILIEYFFCSSFKDFKIFERFIFVKVFLFPPPDKK